MEKNKDIKIRLKITVWHDNRISSINGLISIKRGQWLETADQ
mgnify:CR=1 FL=1